MAEAISPMDIDNNTPSLRPTKSTPPPSSTLILIHSTTYSSSSPFDFIFNMRNTAFKNSNSSMFFFRKLDKQIGVFCERKKSMSCKLEESGTLMVVGKWARTRLQIFGDEGGVKSSLSKREKGTKGTDGGSVEDAKDVCEPNVLNQLMRWKVENLLRLYNRVVTNKSGKTIKNLNLSVSKLYGPIWGLPISLAENIAK